MPKVIIFKKPDCKACAQLVESFKAYVEKHGNPEDFSVEEVYITTEEALVRYSFLDFGKIPALFMVKDGDKEERELAILHWDGRADWRGLRKYLEDSHVEVPVEVAVKAEVLQTA